MEQQENEIKGWLKQILETEIPDKNLFELLKDGIILCNLINKINGITKCKFPSYFKNSFAQMENICYFIENVKKIGIPDSENFQTIDLYENKDMQQVMHCLYSLSRNLYKNGRSEFPVIGPKLVNPVKITFTESQLEDAKRAVSLQYGYMKKCSKDN